MRECAHDIVPRTASCSAAASVAASAARASSEAAESLLACSCLGGDLHEPNTLALSA